MGVPSPLAAGDLYFARALSLVGVARDGIRWALPKRPDSLALEVGVRTRVDLARDVEGRTLSRWAYNLLYNRGGIGGLTCIGGRFREILRRSQAI